MNSIDKAYNLGYKEYGLRVRLIDNPYNPNTQGAEFVTWRAGWYDHEKLQQDAGGEFPILGDDDD